jgi:hypothetical protein
MTSTNHEELAKIPPVQPMAQGDRAYLRLWFALARRPWKSLVLVPSLPDGSAEEAARMLAEVGQKVSGLPVRAITMKSLDYGTALALADLQERIRRLTSELGKAPQTIEVTPGEVDSRSRDWAWGRTSEPVWEGATGEPTSEATLGPASVAQFVIAVPCLISEPLALSATQAADTVVVVVEMGRSKLADVRRIVDQVGRERVAGCILVK